MSESEAVIGARIKEFRERIEWPQSVFALEVGVTRNKLASIEYGTTPLRYGLAARICRRYKISRLWLAKGVGSPQMDWDLGKDVEDNIPHKMLFSRAFSQFLEPAMSAELVNFLKFDDLVGATQIIVPPANVPLGRHLEWFTEMAFRSAVASVPAAMRAAFCDAVIESINSLGTVYSSKLNEQVPLYASVGKVSSPSDPSEVIGEGKIMQYAEGQALLDKSAAMAHSPDVQSLKSVPDLVARLKKLSKKFGSKAALARKLDVSRQAVDQWLNGKTTPSTDIAIKVMNLE